MKVRFKDWNCVLKFNRYVNGETVSISLVDAVDGELVAHATVNIPGLDFDEVAIKDYSENIGMVEALLHAGIIEKPHRAVRSGFVSIPVTRLSQGAMESLTV